MACKVMLNEFSAAVAMFVSSCGLRVTEIRAAFKSLGDAITGLTVIVVRPK